MAWVSKNCLCVSPLAESAPPFSVAGGSPITFALAAIFEFSSTVFASCRGDDEGNKKIESSASGEATEHPFSLVDGSNFQIFCWLGVSSGVIKSSNSVRAEEGIVVNDICLAIFLKADTLSRSCLSWRQSLVTLFSSMKFSACSTKPGSHKLSRMRVCEV